MDLISDSHVPKYAQIADIFRQRISRGIWAQGLRLPANEELAAEFGVSRCCPKTARRRRNMFSCGACTRATSGRIA
jgi:GntR family transcriptional regulator